MNSDFRKEDDDQLSITEYFKNKEDSSNYDELCSATSLYKNLSNSVYKDFGYPREVDKIVKDFIWNKFKQDQYNKDKKNYRLSVLPNLDINIKVSSQEDNVWSLKLQDDLKMSSGLYIIFGTGDSGKSQMIKTILRSNQNFDLFVVGEPFNFDYGKEIHKILLTSDITDLLSIEFMVNSSSRIIIDSLDFLMSYNQGFGLEQSGLPKRPFQFFQALDKVCQVTNKVVIASLPIDGIKHEMLDLVFSKLEAKISGCFRTNIKGDILIYHVKRNLNDENRVSKTAMSFLEFMEQN